MLAEPDDGDEDGVALQVRVELDEVPAVVDVVDGVVVVVVGDVVALEPDDDVVPPELVDAAVPVPAVVVEAGDAEVVPLPAIASTVIAAVLPAARHAPAAATRATVRRRVLTGLRARVVRGRDARRTVGGSTGGGWLGSGGQSLMGFVLHPAARRGGRSLGSIVAAAPLADVRGR